MSYTFSEALETRSSLMKKRSDLVKRMEAIHNGAGEKRMLTTEEQAVWDSLVNQVAEIDKRLTEVEAQIADPGNQPAARAGGMRGLAGFENSTRSGNDSALIRSWLRIGMPSETSEDGGVLMARGYQPGAVALEFRAQSKGTSSAGGYTVPTGFVGYVETAMKAAAPIRQIARVMVTDTGETLKIPVNDDTSNTGAIISENTEHTEQDLTFSEIQVGSFTYSSKLVKVSNELLMDSGVDLEAFLGVQLGERIGRAQEGHFLTGTGSGQPQGIITAASTTSAASATAIAVSDLVNLVRDVEPAYLTDNYSKVAFVMHPTIWHNLRKLADSNSRLLIGDLGNGAPPMLLGYPVHLSSQMDSSIASTKKTVLFGNFNYYLIRDVVGLVLSKSADRFFEYNQTAFLALQRTDAKVLQAGAFRVLAH